MSVSLTGSRSPDDRRRRRLAVAGEGADTADLDAGGVALLRERLGELPSASPWLPRQLWKRNVMLGGFWVALIVIATALIRPLPPHPQIAPAVEHLTAGSRPVLEIYADILLWTCAAQFAALIGWYRSHSQLDFQGRYRVWAWATAVLLAWGFFAGTSLHTAIAAVAAPQLRWPIWRAEVVVWLVPAALAGLSVWWMADRDLQRHRLGLWCVRSAALTLIVSGLCELFATEMSAVAWYPAAQLIVRCLGCGLLLTGLWCQAWFVAYVNADPPEARTPVDWRGHLSTWSGRMWSLLAAVTALWPFRRRTVEAKPKRRVAKKKDEDEEEEAPKRRRKPAAKKRAPAKSRTRTKPEPEYEEEETEEAAEYEEETADETWEEVDDSTAESEDEWTEEYEEEPAPPPVKAPARAVTTPAPATKSAPPPPPPPAKPAQAKAKVEQEYAADEEEDDGDGDDSNYRVDGGQSGADQFKGLSKRQRRELKKQMKDQNR